MPADRDDRGPWEPRKPPRVVAVRRLKRRLKAAASIGLALAAGTFLALHGGARADGPTPAPNPTTPEDANLPAERDTSPPRGGKPKKGKERKKPDKPDKPDKDEHRKGMPVPDNLLE